MTLALVLMNLGFTAGVWDNLTGMSGPMEWYLGLETGPMIFVTIFGILGFYFAFRIIFKLIEKLAEMFH